MAPGGTHEVYRLRVVSDMVMEGVKTGVAGGRKLDGEGRAVGGADKCTWSFTEQTPDGQSKPAWEIVYTRVRESDM